MRDATSSLTRVAVLALLTCFFAVVWSNDQQTQTAFALARKENWRPATAPAVVASPTSARSGRLAKRQPVGRHVTVEMRLPADITPGQYHVIEPTGRMADMVVTIDSGIASSGTRDLYYLDIAGEGRKYFVRIPRRSPDGATEKTAAGDWKNRR